ncbi:hypothetical protein KPL76_05310 [Subtercola sp. PAMC28395]|uniref:hypothetical protein n=1 Tax=Subtercola sp. PAMC28395 TaxID=2846775 RepID=UPI001C0C6F29|nr:hypothetical protein [Subtercola sp. PAMC28395]QWT24786.1 hypothetical protein KPL76_05310 [Subtercola sp. PAMC28395]
MSSGNEHLTHVAELVALRFLTGDGTEIFGRPGGALREGTQGHGVGSLTAIAVADASAFRLRISIAVSITMRVGLRALGGEFSLSEASDTPSDEAVGDPRAHAHADAAPTGRPHQVAVVARWPADTATGFVRVAVSGVNPATVSLANETEAEFTLGAGEYFAELRATNSEEEAQRSIHLNRRTHFSASVTPRAARGDGG